MASPWESYGPAEFEAPAAAAASDAAPAGPWTKYAPQAQSAPAEGPWTKYQSAASTDSDAGKTPPSMLEEMGATALRDTKEQAVSGAKNIKSAFTHGQPEADESFGHYFLRGLAETPGKAGSLAKGLLQEIGVPFAPAISAASVPVARGEAKIIKKAGDVIAPGTGTTEEQIYQDIRPDVSTALGLAARRGTAAAPKVPVRAPKVPAPSVEELEEAASKAYESPVVTSLEIQPSAASGHVQAIQDKLNAIGIDENIAPKTFGVLAKAGKIPDEAKSFTGQNFNSLRRTLGNAAKSNDPTERLAARSAIDSLDDFLPNVPAHEVISGDPAAAGKTLEEARGNYASAMRASAVQEAMEKARNNAGAANSGQNLDNAMRQQIRSILNTPKKRRGFSSDELDQMRTIDRGTRTGDAARFMGNLMGGGGGWGSFATSAIGGAAGFMSTGSPEGFLAGTALPGLGMGFKKLSNILTQTQVDKLDEMLRSRSPLAKTLAGSLHNLGNATQSYSLSTTAGGLAQLSLVARNLSSALNTAGIHVSPNSLINAIRGQGNGNPQNPVQLDQPEDVHHGAERTEIPSPAQAEAGNYRKRHVTWKGLDIAIETEAGQDRAGMGRDGKLWSVTMAHPYGYIKATTGKDGDPIDVYVGPHPNSQRVFVFDQIEPETGKHDEHKLVIGARDVHEARSIYDAGFSDGKGPQRRGAVQEMSVPALKTWLAQGDTDKPIAYDEKAARTRVNQERAAAAPRPSLKDMFADKRSAKDLKAALMRSGVLA